MAVQKPYETFYLSENVRDDVRLEISAISLCDNGCCNACDITLTDAST